MQREPRSKLVVLADATMGRAMEFPARVVTINVNKNPLVACVPTEGQRRLLEDPPLAVSDALMTVDGEDLKLIGVPEGSVYVTTIQLQGSPDHFILVVPQEAVAVELTAPNADSARQWCQDSLVASRALTALNHHLGELLSDVCVQHGGEALLVTEGQVQYLVEVDDGAVKQRLRDSAVSSETLAVLNAVHLVVTSCSKS